MADVNVGQDQNVIYLK